MSEAITPFSDVPKPSVKDSRVLTYLNANNTQLSVNSKADNELMLLWRQKYLIAKADYEAGRCNSKRVKQWRDAYEGIIYKTEADGTVTQERVLPLRRVAYELVEDKVNPRIPAPKMSPRYHADLTPVNATEQLLKHEMNKMLSEETHDESEHATLIDSTSWFKINWNPFDNTHERSGMPTVSVCPVDTIFPQPGVYNYRELEYIFEESKMTLAKVKDLFNKEVIATNDGDLVDIVTCYFLNENRHLGRFIWTEPSGIVLSNDLEWGLRRRRECSKCHHITPIAAECPICGSTKMEYVPVTEEILTEDLVMVKNPYRSGETTDIKQDRIGIDDTSVIPAGTRIPHYLIRQLPFIPRRNSKLSKTLYGLSEVELILENQEMINQFLNKAKRKSAASKTYVTKLKDTAITNENDELSYIEIESAEEGHAIQAKQIIADISEEMAMAENMYNNAKSTTGITNTDQGKADPTARSGKAKQIQMAASQQRKQAPSVMRDSAYAGVYELLFKYMLAFSDETRSFVSLLPDGTQKEEVWSKYMFLSKDENGEWYYRDDFAWSVDNATEITQDRAAMWQLIDNDYVNGAMGNEIDPLRALKMYWQMKEQFGYPTAKYALAFLKDSEMHLPSEIERALMQNPQALQMALSYIQDTQKIAMGGTPGAGAPGQHGGARPNSGPDGNNATHSANVEKTNNKNRAQSGSGQTTTQATTQGGMQGGTGGAK